jgi:hypothetical protein
MVLKCNIYAVNFNLFYATWILDILFLRIRVLHADAYITEPWYICSNKVQLIKGEMGFQSFVLYLKDVHTY